ncbi:SusE domain-containing protein [Dysgonomonas sp. ZJ279]|uniref:SusE domain-containing protein n=1 Tax=Dysgonomonas sp. ZJ279 TaxID=2709796 RepID=UPI0013EC5E04|nr:SusE domain-containing protein [Dysgonomonas sp. ZJ279]
MRNKILLITVSLLTLISFTRCSDDNEFKEVKVTPVVTFYSPDNNRNVILQSSATASLYFEWEKATAEDNGLVYYDVLFDKVDGDFSNPLFVVTADNKGISTGASITHKVLNKIAGLAGIASAEEGSIKWTVMSSRGLTQTKAAAESRIINLTRIAGIDAPDALFLTGEGTENGGDISKALTVKGLEGGNEFEIFTKLLAGKKYYFVDSKNEARRTFSAEATGKTFKENTDGATVKNDGVYRINLDFSTGVYTITEITKLSLFFCPTNSLLFDLDYKGNGIFEGQGFVEFKQESWGRDQRYKFQMEIINSSGQSQTTQWGTKNGTDSAPGSADEKAYFLIKEVSVNQWDDKWKFMSDIDMATAKIKVYFQADNEYTHTVEKVN